MRAWEGIQMGTLLALSAALTASLAAAEVERPALVILDVEAKGVNALEAAAMTSGLVRGARELEAFQVLSSDDVRQLLALERQKQLYGANEGGNLAALQAGVGARHAVVGSLSRAGGYVLEARLLDTATGKVVAQRALPPAASIKDLAPQVVALAQGLLGRLLEGELGHLLVRSSEEGSEVLVDDQLVASTPMLRPASLPRGRHRVLVRKEGFIARSSVVQVTLGQLTVEEATLLPSPDFASAWERQHSRKRLGAWLTTGAAVLALGGALAVDRLVSEPLYRREFLPRYSTLVLESRDPEALAGPPLESPVAQACAADTGACRREAEQLGQQLKNQQYLGLGLLGVGAVCTGLASYFWLSGEDPGRYGHLVVGGQAGPGQASLSVGGSF